MATPGSIVNSGSLVAPGGGTGSTGMTGPTGPTGVSANAGNAATLGSDNLIYVPDSGIASVISQRTRGFNAIGNPNFECCQQVSTATLGAGTVNAKALDRWTTYKTAATGTCTVQQYPPPTTYNGINAPGGNFCISSQCLQIQPGTLQASLAAGDNLYIMQSVEGSQFRELSNDVFSIQILASADVATSFSVFLRDNNNTHSIVWLCSLPATTPTLFKIPNIAWSPSGVYSTNPGTLGYTIGICLAAGSTFVAPAAGAWQNGNFLAAPGTSNFLGRMGAFYACFVQHEPGPLCTQLIDKPFSQNYQECLRYFQKSYPYGIAIGATTAGNGVRLFVPANGLQPITPVFFKTTMAKAPTITGYSPATGAANNVRDLNTPADRAITGVLEPYDAQFAGFTVTGGLSTIWQGAFHYTADTGW